MKPFRQATFIYVCFSLFVAAAFYVAIAIQQPDMFFKFGDIEHDRLIDAIIRVNFICALLHVVMFPINLILHVVAVVKRRCFTTYYYLNFTLAGILIGLIYWEYGYSWITFD